MTRTAQQIIDQTNEIARIIYESRGYEVKSGHKFYESDRINYHPQEGQAWYAACEIQLFMTETDPEDALTELEDV